MTDRCSNTAHTASTAPTTYAGPRALLACAPDEQHTFGLIAFGVALNHFGWRMTYLGANTGVAMIDEAATHIEPDLVVVAAALPERLVPIIDGLRALGEPSSARDSMCCVS